MTVAATIDIELVRQPRDYEPRLFVKRGAELEIIRTKIQRAQHGTIVKPIVNFWGVSGIGKTWLLNYLYEQYRYSPEKPKLPSERPTVALRHVFVDEASTALSVITTSLAQDLLDQLLPVLSEDDHKRVLQAEGSGNPKELVRVLGNLSKKFVPLILLDNAEVVTKRGQEQLEQHLIEPLALNNRILIVLAGRRYVPHWQSFEVRRRVMEHSDTQVLAFDKALVQEQIQRGEYDIPVEWIYPYTAGNPHLTNALATQIHRWAKGEQFDLKWFNQHRSYLLPLLRTYEDDLVQQVSAELRPAFYAVSPLRSYRLEALRFMLNDAGAAKAQPDGHYLNILHELDKQTEIVWWSHAHRAYVTDDMVRRVINRRQWLEDTYRFVTLHRKAWQMYWEWAKRYKEASEDFIIEIWFHLGNLYLVTEDKAELETKTMQALEFAKTHLTPDRRMILRKCLENEIHPGDKELLDLLPEDLCQKLRQALT